MLFESSTERLLLFPPQIVAMLRHGLKLVPLVAFTSAMSTHLALASSQAPDANDEVQSEIAAVRRENVEKKWYVRVLLVIPS